jgi:hypothetical protein
MDDWYAIRLRGDLGARLRAAFPGLDARRDGADTLLVGGLPDQAALYGVLGQIEALGLELLEVRRDDGPGRPSPGRPAQAESAVSDDDFSSH